MPEQAVSEPSNQAFTMNVAPQSKELSPDFQRDITNEESHRQSFYAVFCGKRYVEVEMPVDSSSPAYKLRKKEWVRKEITDYNARMCNESCADFLFENIKPLISRLTATSSYDYDAVYNQWNGFMIATTLDLLDSVFFEVLTALRDRNGDYILDENGKPKMALVQNPYDINPHRIPKIISHLCAYYLISLKGKEGFMLRETAETFMSTNIRNQTMPVLQMPQENKKGFWGKIWG